MQDRQLLVVLETRVLTEDLVGGGGEFVQVKVELACPRTYVKRRTSALQNVLQIRRHRCSTCLMNRD